MAQIGQRPDVEDKIREITNRIVRGKHARDNPAISFYRFAAYLKTISVGLTGIGIGNPFVAVLDGRGSQPTIAAVAASFHGVPLIVFVGGIAVYVFIVVAQRLITSGNLEQKAVHSLALFDTMRRFDLQLRARLAVADPMTQLIQLQENIFAIEDTSFEVMPDYDKYADESQRTSASIIEVFCHHWDSNAPGLERRK